MSEWPASLPGYLDAPVDGSMLPATPAWIRGWTPWFDGGPARVVVRVGGRRVGLARIACPRPDVAALTDHPFAPICGFEMMLDLADLGPGDALIEVVAEGRGGEHRRIGAARVTVAEARTVDPGVARPAPRRAERPGPLHVAAATNIFDLGGATTFFTDLVTRLHGSGFVVRATAPVDGPHRRWLEDAGVETALLPAPPVHDPEAYEAWLDEVAPFVEGADVMLPNTLATFGFADLATRRGIPTVWPVHEPMGMRAFWEVGYRGAMHPRVRALAEDAFRHASAVTICAEATAEACRPFTDPGRVHVVRYGIDFEALAAAAAPIDRTAARRVEEIPQDALVVLCVGIVEERKGQGVLAQAFATLGERHPGTVLVLLGARDRDPLLGALREHLRRSGDDGRVRIVPASPDRVRWLIMADLLVCASDLEVLPLAVLEGMALGLPVVSTGVFGLPDVVIEGRTGFVCRPCDVEDLAEALSRALDDPGRWPDMSREAAALVRERYAVAPFVGAHAQLLKEAARGTSPNRPPPPVR